MEIKIEDGKVVTEIYGETQPRFLFKEGKLNAKQVNDLIETLQYIAKYEEAMEEAKKILKPVRVPKPRKAKAKEKAVEYDVDFIEEVRNSPGPGVEDHPWLANDGSGVIANG